MFTQSQIFALHPHDFVQWAFDLRQVAPDAPAILAIIGATKGSTPRDCGTAMLISPSGVFGTIGGGALEWQVIARAQALIGKANIHTHEEFILGPDIGQCCGGAITILYRTVSAIDINRLAEANANKNATQFIHISPDSIAFSQASNANGTDTIVYNCTTQPNKLAIFGAGHVSQACVKIAQSLPLTVEVFDDRPDMRAKIPLAPNVQCSQLEAGYQISHSLHTAILIMTHEHDLDYQCAIWALQMGEFAYVGVIGSKTKAARFRQRMARDGLDQAMIDRLIMPIGKKIEMGNYPEIIALSALNDIMYTLAANE